MKHATPLNKSDMEVLLAQFRKAFNAREERNLRVALIWMRGKFPEKKQKELEADWLSIHNAIAHFYQDSGLDKFVLRKYRN